MIGCGVESMCSNMRSVREGTASAYLLPLGVSALAAIAFTSPPRKTRGRAGQNDGFHVRVTCEIDPDIFELGVNIWCNCIQRSGLLMGNGRNPVLIVDQQKFVSLIAHRGSPK